MTTAETGRLAINEFTFRYLYPEQERKQRYPLDALERRHQAAVPGPDAGAGQDLAPLFQRLAAGHAPAGTLSERLIGLLMQVHSPVTVTPRGPFGTHASYPSPRAYYPLQFSLYDAEPGRGFRIDLDALRLHGMAAFPAEAAPGARYTLLVQADFERYDALYNLFRKSLYTLELGHFLSEFMELARRCGIAAGVRQSAAGFCVDIYGDAGDERCPDGVFEEHRRFARARNSGRYHRGLYPVAARCNATQLGALRDALDAAMGQLETMFPSVPAMRLTPTLCLRAGEGVSPGIYRHVGGALQCISLDDPVDVFDTLYSYPDFSFRTVPAMVFLCVDELAYACSAPAFLELNCALGYLSQAMIRSLTGDGWFARPFRSYQQVGVDRLLQNRAAGLRTYYGLLIGKNRSQEPLVTLL
ncbi:hypothetical protein [Massilia consociata]|uniref:Uncharacterized protein n=1 Tax=Massilia consociata TaxID=760117 RepID=A0ABV6FGR9_9BURK